MSKMKTLKLFFVCFLILSFASMSIAKPAMGMGKAPGKNKHAAVAEVPELPPYPEGMEDGIARNPDGSTRYLLRVEEGFQPSDVEDINGTCEWLWSEAGIAAVSSFSQTFVEDAQGNLENNIEYAVPEPLVVYDTFFMSDEQPASQTTQIPDEEIRLQWPLQAIGAVRYAEDGRTPEWQLSDYEGEGVTIAVLDSGMPALWLNYPYPLPDTLPPAPPGGWESMLHPAFAWYQPGDGGILPVFRSVEEYIDYYNTYPDPRLPDPATNPWDTGEVIIDPVIGGIADTSGHSTQVSGVIASRNHVRGIAPKVKLISYKTVAFGIWQNPSKVLYAFMRAPLDGVQVINTSWGYFFTKNDLLLFGISGFRQIFMHALQELDKQNILICSAAANYGANYQEAHQSSGPYFFLPQLYTPNVLNVAGTAPRDYDPDAPDLRDYKPEPGEAKELITETWPEYPWTLKTFTIPGGKHNLDRPGVFSYPDGSTCFGKEMAAIDIAAPSGSLPPLDQDGNMLVHNGYYLVFQMRLIEDDPYYYYYGAGTSYSAPTVTGVAALAIEAYRKAHGQNPSLQQLKSVLLNSADDLVGPPTDVIYKWVGMDLFIDVLSGNLQNWDLMQLEADKPANDDFYGHGRVNAKKAILEAGGILD